ncbi:Na+/H+ antiporter subunit E [Nocardiopsis sp. ATB16-24]|uniref:Na+/H+ antiporter subunit E n=1 Tax=Nocardiopsis sp. ATB16-24 TaxID=3019555 RepID=UPI00255637DC|nr:Na+/H+ antiporter subunit E [Nocardiopsis sp. ATB16-24]
MTSLLLRGARTLWFPFAYAGHVVSASVRMSWDVLTPGSASTPAFVEVPLRCRTAFEVTTIANMVSLAPGSVTVATRMDPPTLWVHGMYAPTDEAFRDTVYAMEDRLLGVTRRKGPPPRPDVGEGETR